MTPTSTVFRYPLYVFTDPEVISAIAEALDGCDKVGYWRGIVGEMEQVRDS